MIQPPEPDRHLPVIDSMFTVMLMLCDAADIVNGKLVVRGGGWSSAVASMASHALGVTVYACPTYGGRTITLNLRLVDDLGDPVPLFTPTGVEPTKVTTELLLPDAVHEDVPVSRNLAVTLPWVELPPGGVMHWIATIDQAPEEQWSCSFYVSTP